MFKILKVFDKLRVDDATISGFGGLDKAEHGEYAYVLNPHIDGTVIEPPTMDRKSPSPPGTWNSSINGKPPTTNPTYTNGISGEFGFN